MEFEQLAAIVLESAPTALPLLWVVWRQNLAIERMHQMIERMCAPCIDRIAASDDSSTSTQSD